VQPYETPRDLCLSREANLALVGMLRDAWRRLTSAEYVHAPNGRIRLDWLFIES